MTIYVPFSLIHMVRSMLWILYGVKMSVNAD